MPRQLKQKRNKPAIEIISIDEPQDSPTKQFLREWCDWIFLAFAILTGLIIASLLDGSF